MSQRALLLVNRHARRGQADLSSAIERLHALGLELTEKPIEAPQSLSDTIRQYRDQVDLVIVGGGDGTLNAAIEGLIEVQLPFGILPLGTANDLARTLGIPSDLAKACDVIAAGRQERIDLGWVNGKYFFNTASLGLSVQIARQLDKSAKRRWGVLAYAMTAIRVLWQSRPFWAGLQVDRAKVRQVRTVQIAVGNGRYYGGQLTVSNDASMDDRRLDVYSLNIRHWWQMLALLPAMRSGDYSSHSCVETFRCQEIQIETRRPYAINTDGELTTYTPARFRVIPQALSVLVPS